MKNIVSQITALLLGAKRWAEFTRFLALPGRVKCVLAALAPEITKIRTVPRGRRTMRKIRKLAARRARPRESFLLRNERQREERQRCGKFREGNCGGSFGGGSATCFAT